MTFVVFFVSLSSLCFATDEDGWAVENFCNTLFKCERNTIYFQLMKLIYKAVSALTHFRCRQRHCLYKQTWRRVVSDGRCGQ